MPVQDAPRSQDDIDCASHSHAKAAQPSVVTRGLNDNVFAAENDQLQSAKKPSHFIELLVELASLENFGKDQVANGEFLRVEQAFQQVSLDGRFSSEIVDPDT